MKPWRQRLSAWRTPLLFAGLVAACWFMPVERGPAGHLLVETLRLVRWYTREHLFPVLVPAFLIAGAIVTFVRRDALLSRLGPSAPKRWAYATAAAAGSVLAVCSCTVLPLFAGIYRLGAGLGPACTLLYAGPAVNVLAVILTARVLGPGLGWARAAGAVLFSVLIGLAMQALFRRSESVRAAAAARPPAPRAPLRPVWQRCLLVAAPAAVLVFANLARSGDVRAVFVCCPGGLELVAVEGRLVAETADELRVVDERGRRHVIPRGTLRRIESRPRTGDQRVRLASSVLTAAALAALLLMAGFWLRPGERRTWFTESWGLASRMLPLLLAGIMAAGFLLGSMRAPGLIPPRWIAAALGENSAGACLFASVVGVLMYFATLTEVPILQGLAARGMADGPALSLLLAGPALSLPAILVVRSVLGWRRTLAFVALVLLMSALAGLLYGAMQAAPGTGMSAG